MPATLAHAARLLTRHRVLIVAAASGILGFRLGIVVFPDWQAAVETAQVVAGVVRYPEATPFFIYHTRLWTILHQVLAIFLRAGVSEIRLSLILSGLLGMLSFQALAMFVYALSEDVLLAIGAPLLILLTRASDFGVVYPISLMGTVDTYGIAGLSLFVLVVALIGAGVYRPAGFLLGLAPSIHPSIGFWLFIVVAIGFAWDRRQFREAAASGGWYFVAGCLVTGVSLVLNRISAFGPTADPAVSERYLATFVAIWDVHRQPVAMTLDGVALNRGALALALVWLFALRRDLPGPAAFLLRAVTVAAVLSFVFIALSWLPPDMFPGVLLTFMPTRIANFNAMIFVALLLGLAGAYRRRVWGLPLALVLAVALLLNGGSRIREWRDLAAVPPLDLWSVFDIAALLLIVAALASSYTPRAGATCPTSGARLLRVCGVGARVAWAALVVAMAVGSWRWSAPRSFRFANYTNDALFQIASQGEGLLLTGGNLNLVQLRTRRAVLLNGGGLDALPYVPDTGVEVDRILREVYAIDFFHPPDEARRSGAIPNAYNKAVWEQFAVEKWRQIAYSFKVTQVLTYGNWSLQLPVIAQDRDYRLYEIPR